MEPSSLDLLLVLFVVVYLFLSSIFDLKTREVPDLLSYSLIIIALSLRLIYSIISKDFSFFLTGLLGFVIFFIVANIMYYSKQWGGADAKLLMGLGASLPSYPQTLIPALNPNLDKIPFMLTLFLNLIIVGALYALLYSIIISIKNKNKLKEHFASTLKSKNISKIRKIIIFTSLIVIIYALIQQNNLIRFISSLIAFSLLFLFYLVVFLKAVERSSLIKKVNVNTLTPGDWVTHKITMGKTQVYDPKKGYGLTSQQISKIKKFGIKNVEIKQGIPFVPSFFVSTILSLFYGNLISGFIKI